MTHLRLDWRRRSSSRRSFRSDRRPYENGSPSRKTPGGNREPVVGAQPAEDPPGVLAQGAVLLGEQQHFDGAHLPGHRGWLASPARRSASRLGLGTYMV